MEEKHRIPQLQHHLDRVVDKQATKQVHLDPMEVHHHHHHRVHMAVMDIHKNQLTLFHQNI
jgi:hypothetical protein